MKYCVINLATKNAWYAEGQARLHQSLLSNGFQGDFLGFIGEDSLDCLQHTNTPYAFKPAAFLKAKELGYDCALWVDASFWAVKDIDPLFQLILNQKYLFQNCEHNVGTWCSDAALQTLGITRGEAFQLIMFSGGFVGLHLNDNTTMGFLKQWYTYSIDGITFKGSWTNKNKEVSNNVRVQGHRHDMVAGTVITSRLGMQHNTLNTLFCYKETYDKWLSENNHEALNAVYFVCQGM